MWTQRKQRQKKATKTCRMDRRGVDSCWGSVTSAKEVRAQDVAWHYTFSTFPKFLLCYVHCSSYSLPAPIAQSIKIFSTYFISCLFYPTPGNILNFFDSRKPDCFLKIHSLIPSLFTSGCIIITSSSSITLPHRAALLFPSLCRHLCFQALLRTYLQVN